MSVTAEMTEIVLPKDINSHETLLGGQLIHWMDMTAALAAKKFTHHRVVTLAIDFLKFIEPAAVGDYVIVRATLTHVFRTSMEIEVKCFLFHPIRQEQEKLMSQGYFIFVALDENDSLIELPEFMPATQLEIQKAVEAEKRRQIRLAADWA